MPSPPRSQPAAPFASRELNGEVLLDELADLRAAQVQQQHLNDCVWAVKELSGQRVREVGPRLKKIAAGRFGQQPAIARLLVTWAGRLKSDVDVAPLVGHFERLALVSAMVGALRRGSDRLPRAGRG